MKTLSDYMKMNYRMEIVEDAEEGGFVVSFPELSGCLTCGDTKEKAIGQNVIGSLKPGQVLVKIVHDELVSLLGTEMVTVDYSKDPTIIMMVGLQGSGKTTTAGKIAKLITEKQGKKPLLVAGDIYRPAAIDQLKTLGAQLNIPVFSNCLLYTSDAADEL
mgnify:CR=1 FL=1